MEQLLEFIGNHPFLFSALAAVATFMIVTEFRRGTGPKRVSTMEAVRLVNQEDAMVLDIREAGEFKSGHILNAKNIPLSQLDERIKSLKTDKLTPIVVYCKTGNVSPAACTKLTTHGYQNVSLLKSGLYSWQDANLPVTK